MPDVPVNPCAPKHGWCTLQRPRILPYRAVRIAGIELTYRAVLALAAQLRQHGYECTAISIERAFDAVAHDYALSIEQREQVLRSLDNRPDRHLGQLRERLLGKHVDEARRELV